MAIYKDMRTGEIVDAVQINPRGLIGEDWFWDAVTDNKIITFNFGKYHKEDAWCFVFIGVKKYGYKAETWDYIVKDSKGEILPYDRYKFELDFRKI